MIFSHVKILMTSYVQLSFFSFISISLKHLRTLLANMRQPSVIFGHFRKFLNNFKLMGNVRLSFGQSSENFQNGNLREIAKISLILLFI